MEATARELLDLVVRWVHVIAGIMWIGNSLLFNWLDRNLTPPAEPKAGVEGEIWLLHSGGFYQVEKKQLAPWQLPAQLHWFKWQNFTTWVSGILLLIIVYYLGGAAYMVDPGVAEISVGTAIAIGVGVLVGSWFVYDLLWRSPIGKNPLLAAAISLVLLIATTYGLAQTLSGRAAYIHIGAMLGTLMTGNVWLHIMPSQRALVAATKAGQRPDPALAQRAKQRSIHNNYMTFPLLFIMVSNHFPSTYSNQLNWLILAILMLASAAIRHFMNVRFWYRGWLRAAAGTALVALALVLVLMARTRGPTSVAASSQPVPFTTVQAIIRQRCLACHSATPTDSQFTAAPAGVTFDTPEQIRRMAGRIKERAVVSKTMPLGNKTGMTEEERALLGAWIDQGANTR